MNYVKMKIWCDHKIYKKKIFFQPTTWLSSVMEHGCVNDSAQILHKK